MAIGSWGDVFDVGMSIEITVSVPPDFLSTAKFEQELPRYLRGAGETIKNFWYTEAGRVLKSSRAIYQDAIDVDFSEVSRGEVTFSLVGELATMVERGSAEGSFDMKPGLLKNAKVAIPRNTLDRHPYGKARKRGKAGQRTWNVPPPSLGGRYRVVPLNTNRETILRRGQRLANPTFRTVTEWGAGWIWKSKRPPYEILNEVQREGENIVHSAVLKLIEETL